MSDPVQAAAAEPLGVWDCKVNWFPWEHWQEASKWASEHFRDVNRTYRAEFYLVDAPFAVLYRFAENENGKLFRDPASDDVAVDEPVVQLLDSLPPRYLLEGRRA